MNFLRKTAPKILTLARSRPFSLSSRLQIKQIQEIENGNELIIKGVTVESGREPLESGREPHLLENAVPTACPVCSSGLDIKHTDVLILSQFVRNDGLMLPRRITGLCLTQRKRMSNLVTMAQKAGLMCSLGPANSKRDPKRRSGWKKFNKYFDESTIKYKLS